MANIPFDFKKLIIICCVIIVALGISLRVEHMLSVEDQYAIPDLNRDLMVGYHIANYNEFNLIGPDSTSGLPLDNSSLFFILTAFTGFIFGFTTLGINIGNLVYQIASVGLLYGATRNVFGTTAAVFSASLMLVADVFINQSGFFWQPHLMQVVYLIALYLLSLGYAKQNIWYTYLSIFVFVASMGTHYPSVVALPVFGIAVWMVLFSLRAHKVHYLTTALFGVLSVGVIFSTAIVYRFLGPEPTPLPPVQLPDFSIGYYLSTALYRTQYLIAYYFPKADTALLQYIVLIAIAGACVWYFATVQTETKRWSFAVVLAGVVAILFGVTVTYFPYESFVAYPLRYYTAVYAPLTILLGVLLAEGWSRRPLVCKYVTLGIFGVLLVCVGSYFMTPPEPPRGISQHSETQFLYNDKAPVEKINTAMLSAIKRYDLVHAFDVVTFDGEDGFFMNERADDIIWYPLEQRMGVQLVTLDDAALRSYSPIGDITHVLVRCRAVTQERCLELIATSLPSPYEQYQVIVEQLSDGPDPAYLLKQ